MEKPCCRNCAYAGQVAAAMCCLLICLNAPEAPGRMVAVQPESVCRHFRRKRGPVVRPVPPEPPDGVRHIPLTQNRFALVDAEDYERVNAHRWCVSGRGSRAYACRCAQGRHVSMHRFLMNPPPGMVVDHIDGNGLNNRRCNLRICTQQQNTYNSRPKGKSSKYKGVCRDKAKKKWVVYVRYKERNIFVGRFEDEVEAARAYDRTAFALFGEFAYLNFPQEFGRAALRRDTINV